MAHFSSLFIINQFNISKQSLSLPSFQKATKILYQPASTSILQTSSPTMSTSSASSTYSQDTCFTQSPQMKAAYLAPTTSSKPSKRQWVKKVFDFPAPTLEDRMHQHQVFSQTRPM